MDNHRSRRTLVLGLLAIGSVAASCAVGNPTNVSRSDATEPTPIAPGMISTRMGEHSPVLDTERGELYFMRRTPGRFDYTIYMSRRINGAWTTPEVASFSGEHRDAGPSLSPDGETLLFDSDRPAAGLEAGSINIWRVTRADGNGWSEPELVRSASENPEAPTRAGADEFGAYMDSESNVYFYSFRPPFRGGSHYVIEPGEAEAAQRERNLPDPSFDQFVAYLAISSDGRTAVLEGRGRRGTETDLYLSRQDGDGRWSEPVRLDAINTAANEGTPALSPDGEYLLFASTRPTGDGRAAGSNLYMVRLSDVLPPE